MDVGQTVSGFIPYGYSLAEPVVQDRSNRLRVQNELMRVAKLGTYFAVSYDPESGQAIETDPDSSEVVEPATVLANETGSHFAVDIKLGRRYARKRSIWLYSLIVEFHREVSVELFEASLLDSPIILPRIDAYGLSQVTLHLTSTRVTHPVTQQASKGTRAEFAFDAEVGRI